MLKHLVITLGFTLLINIVMFLIAYRYKTDKLTDISYAVSFVVLVLYSLGAGAINPLDLALTAMVVLWALRLGGFLLIRVWNKGRDKRFDTMRGNFLAFGRFWVLQAVTVWVVLLPVFLTLFKNADGVEFGKLVALGAIVWALGLIIEAAADLQKYEFTKSPANKGKWIDSGLWRYSRHPNYFGEILVWLGIYVFTLSVLSGREAAVGAIGPVFITALLLFISGIPILEKLANKKWGANKAYINYKKNTSLLVPLPKKSDV